MTVCSKKKGNIVTDSRATKHSNIIKNITEQQIPTLYRTDSLKQK
jgi:hypothetical protein